jgi:hypothetical protein
MNRFPDTIEKRELRRRDRRRLAQFQIESSLNAGLSYCGLPSSEFLDVREWLPHLKSAFAVERDAEVLEDMRIQKNILLPKLKITFAEGDIFDVLKSTPEAFDVYNLDPYGEFLFPTKDDNAKGTDALRALIRRHGERRQPCLLIATYNARDTGKNDYLRYLDDLPLRMSSWGRISDNVTSHRHDHSRLMKACIPLFILHECRKHDIELRVDAPFAYQSSARMIHFVMELVPASSTLTMATSEENEIARILNLPLRQIVGMVPQTVFAPVRLERD